MEPNPGDIYNEGYEAGYKAGKAEKEKAVEAKNDEWKEAVQLISPTEIHINPEVIMRLLAPTKTDKQTEV